MHLNRAHRFGLDQAGSIAWPFLWLLVVLAVTGLAIDLGNAWRQQAMLQVTATAAAHAGALGLPDPDIAAEQATRVARLNLPTASFGEVTPATLVQTGRWDPQRRQLDTDSTEPDAVRAVALRTRANGNPVPTYLLDLARIDHFDVAAESIVQRFVPDCLRHGLIANGRVLLSSDNTIPASLCIHGAEGLSPGSGNIFAEGADVSTRHPASLAAGTIALADNPGLAEALHAADHRSRLVRHLTQVIAALGSGTSPRPGGQIDAPGEAPVELAAAILDPAEVQQGRLHVVSCPAGERLVIPGPVLRRAVIVTDCPVHLSADARLHDVTIATTSLSDTAVTADEGAAIGARDDCAPGGGAQILALGGIALTQPVTLDGAQLAAGRSIALAVLPGGIRSSSVQAGQDIALLTDGALGTCPGPADFVYDPGHYRVVK
jgi:hypothetical protein